MRLRARQVHVPGGFISCGEKFGLYPEGTGQTLEGKQERDKISSENKEDHSHCEVENGWKGQAWRQ